MNEKLWKIENEGLQPIESVVDRSDLFPQSVLFVVTVFERVGHLRLQLRDVDQRVRALVQFPLCEFHLPQPAETQQTQQFTRQFL